ncbi:unnamed protein product [Schistosoma bovis]|uniref:TM2 domain-containing protein n=2 Tax=Schistosoma TaxID=6181 RepID=A0AA85B0I5_9TREM|nr:TM2 domain-containing protein 3 [Schistosoma haematobium]CAH8643872.1 unnamed protein product [Schistosoma mattheei]CAH8651380.1 unnamed protein product [Schistosoma intercalatum]CAH8674263.1 unnamed protein product [Schistosoma bovis]KAH9592497.1 TM2 domain-containing protein 3 [Schistosoma haematobium]CAH8653075.1 unnamed protein product [Schistosoma intercalatum]
MLFTTKIPSRIIISLGCFFLVHYIFGHSLSDVVQNVYVNASHPSVSLFPASNLSSPKNEPSTNQTTQAKWQHLCPYMKYKCSELPGYCLMCNFNTSCVYGAVVNVTCFPRPGVYCKDSSGIAQENQTSQTNSSDFSYPMNDQTNYLIQKPIVCRFCHQLGDTEIVCIGRTNCRQPNVPRSFYETKCEPFPHILCLGRRVFRRMVPCDWSSGKSYVLTVILSLFFGGLGVDRFYLGMWIEGLGKLFSFGGLGLWSIVDFILIVSGYVKPPGDAVYW